MTALAETGAQLVVTAINAESVPIAENIDSRMFHVEHGMLKTVV
jgi:recombinational DNA repair ATPase RecF